MATDVFITPASGTIDFNNGVLGSVLGTIATMKVYDSLTTGNLSIQNATSGVRFLNRGNTGNIFEAYGTYGNLFTVSDDLTDSIFSVNTSAGVPVLDVYSNNSVYAGQYNANDFVINSNKVGIGTKTFTYTINDNTRLVGSNTNNKLFINGSVQLLNDNDAIVIGRGTATFLSDEELGFGWGGGWYMTDGTYLRVRNNKTLYTTGEIWGAVFKDSNNTAYYVDPASTGYSAYFAGAIQATKIGIEDSGIDCYMEITDANPVIYGVTYGGEFIFYGDKSTPASFLYYGGATVTYTLQANSSLRAPIFYDSDNTGYYIDPNGASSINTITSAQYYTTGWFRNNSSGNGLYNESTGEHFYSDAGDMWNVASANGTQGIRLRTGGHNGTIRGYFYGNDSNDVGLLNNGGNWRVRVVGGDYVLFDGSSARAQVFYDSNDTNYYVDPASTSVLNRINYQQLRRNFASSVYSGPPSGSNLVKTFSGVLVAGSANGSTNTYTVIETTIPQGNYQMGGFTINWFENYSSTNGKTKIEIAGYWNPTSNGGFIGFEFTSSNPNIQPTIQVGANASGNTVFILTHYSSNYPVIVARDLWFGYNSSDAEYGTGWTMTNTNSIAAYTNLVTATLRVGPTLTGTGASGTWGINITGSSASCTGNAATATTATTASSCSGNSATVTDGVYLSTTQTISGSKTFSVDITVNGIKAGRGVGGIISNAAFGRSALNANTTGANNNAFGRYALFSNTSGQYNCAFGIQSLYYNTIGNQNTSFGNLSMIANVNGSGNCAFGYNTLNGNVASTCNTAMGKSSLSVAEASNNSAFGYETLCFNNTGNKNSAFGSGALRNNLSGNSNCAFGYRALYSNQPGNKNNAFGYKALLNNLTGGNNNAFGYYALKAVTGGNNNTAIGQSAGSNITTGSNNTCIGQGSAASSASVSNEITLGNASITSLRCQVTTITALSDQRDKADIEPIDVGLNFIEKLKPVTFKWDKREWYTDGIKDGSKKENILQAGFIAQDLKKLQEETGLEYLKLVNESNPDKLEATPGNLFVPLIKAVQELSQKVKILENRIHILENR